MHSTMHDLRSTTMDRAKGTTHESHLGRELKGATLVDH